MSESQCRRWEQFRNRGEVFYVLVWGILVTGGGILILSLSWSRYFLHEHFDPDDLQVLQKALECLVSGFVLGTWNWHSNERSYRKAQEEKQDKNAQL
jgi:hypothetical protein